MNVTYTAVVQPHNWWFSPFDRWFPRYYQPKTLAHGSAVTDEAGSWKLSVPTQHDPQTLEVTTDLRDASGRTVGSDRIDADRPRTVLYRTAIAVF